MQSVDEAAINRFWAKVEKTDTCWYWRGNYSYNGYGKLAIDGQCIGAHRYAYILTRGPVPKGHDVHHLCKCRGCVNPDHLETVTHRENLQRSIFTLPVKNAAKTHCPKGHPYSEENTYYQPLPKGLVGRRCRICMRESVVAHYRRHPRTKKAAFFIAS